MKFSDLLGDEQPEGDAPLAPTPPAAEPIGVLAAEPPPAPALPAMPAPEAPTAESPLLAPVAPSTAEVLDRSSHLAAVNVAPEVAAPIAPPEEPDRIEAFETFDDDLLPSARTRRNRR